MRRLFRFVTTTLVGLVLAVLTVSAQTAFPSDLPSTSAGETGELTIYPRPTQIGTSARRTIRDQSGKIAREVFYSSSSINLVPGSERDLRVQSIGVYFYDTAGRVDRIEHWGVGRKAPRVEQNAYDPVRGLTRKWYVEPDGVRRYETRFTGSKTTTHLYYDDTGSYLTSLRGQIVDDVNLPHGWGMTSGDLACGITLSTERARLDDIAVWVNIKNVAEEHVHIFTLQEPLFELRNAAGKTIPMRKGGPSSQDQSQRHLNGQVLERDSVGFMYPAYKLADYFDPLPPGKYTLRIRQPVPERNVNLDSNDVTLIVL